MPSLFVVRGHDQGARFELDEPVVNVGRDASNRIQLHDTEVSRLHVELRLTDRGYTVTDLNSSNGTFVNGKRVQKYRLASGDQVQLGSTLMLYTGPPGDGAEDLAEKIDITSSHLPGDQSHIIRSVTQQEGSQLFDLKPDLPQSSWLTRTKGNLQVMYRIALAVSHTLDIDQLLQRILDLIFEWVEADRGCVMLLNPDRKSLLPKVRRTARACRSKRRSLSARRFSIM